MENDSKFKIIAVVINEVNYKEYDKLFTLFTKTLGKIKSYAFGVRRQNSKKIGTLRLFSFCEVELKESLGKYNIEDANIINSFDEIAADYESMCYASYFVEVVDYLSFENIESSEIFYLLYYSFKALVDKKVDYKLIKLIFDLKILKYQGEYIMSDMITNQNETLKYTWDYVLNSEVKRLYSFNLSDDVYNLFKKEVDKEFKNKIDMKFKSLKNQISNG
ncbi:MAG: DNA repair protein RecO [Lachnospiraceae bacterium]|nr:DNA repair protein RecO [Lachnospiraceae bacterium]